jgi:hypothetical protein
VVAAAAGAAGLLLQAATLAAINKPNVIFVNVEPVVFI